MRKRANDTNTVVRTTLGRRVPMCPMDSPLQLNCIRIRREGARTRPGNLTMQRAAIE
ncbi:hypothetical protein ARMGADRAFT_1004138 [Armillaria gallica]|uniref:Uncharacterized protein n=1 Tax=Armillaria gallica TaxID=47427 RepID=A0A2H3E7G4_ARMGA|nr:hypothetical protein ARMGADRAFT_1004138 [Armillaria gallica]